MAEKIAHTVYTIGHSTHTIAEFIAMLQPYGIQLLVDVRRFPMSRKFPQFNEQNLQKALAGVDIQYIHLADLGGRRKAEKNSHNTRWHNEAFRGYADYMETSTFKKSVNELEHLASAKTTAYMCSEAVWWRCHRSLISDYLKAKGWQVMHIMSVDKLQEHPYTAAARIKNNKVFYTEDTLFDNNSKTDESKI